MRKEIYICDQCGTEKKQTNHWLAVCFHRAVPLIEIRPFSGARECDEHVCGLECLMKKVSLFEEQIRLADDYAA